MDKKSEIIKFAEKRPDSQAVFGYGSGVFEQRDNDHSKSQTDVIFIVNDIREWHDTNMSMNDSDYSFLGRIHFSSTNVSKIKGKNNVTYFSHIKDSDNDFMFKYGVVEVEDFIRGLSTWDNLFLVGRFHKPVLDVKSNEVIRRVIESNRDVAFRIACLFSPASTTKREFFKTLCGLSYLGDARMKIAENPNKVRNIVDGSYSRLKEMYSFDKPYVKTYGVDKLLIDPRTILEEIHLLPEALVDYLAEMDTDLSDLEMVKRNILDYIVGHNKIESRAQIIEGLKTNGVMRSVPYALAKVQKKLMK